MPVLWKVGMLALAALLLITAVWLPPRTAMAAPMGQPTFGEVRAAQGEPPVNEDHPAEFEQVPTPVLTAVALGALGAMWYSRRRPAT